MPSAGDWAGLCDPPVWLLEQGQRGTSRGGRGHGQQVRAPASGFLQPLLVAFLAALCQEERAWWMKLGATGVKLEYFLVGRWLLLQPLQESSSWLSVSSPAWQLQSSVRAHSLGSSVWAGEGMKAPITKRQGKKTAIKKPADPAYPVPGVGGSVVQLPPAARSRRCAGGRLGGARCSRTRDLLLHGSSSHLWIKAGQVLTA